MGINISISMNLPIPGVGSEAGPQYAQDVNNCLTLIDGHNHTPGYGVQITPNGLNINSDLPMNANNLTTARTVRFTPQLAALTAIADIGCLYEVVNDLYYNDGLGNNIRITQSGGIAGTPGSISNLVPPASASYVSLSQTFVWQSDTNTAANLDVGFIILRTANANSPGLTLQVPATISSDYTISLPLLPASTLPLQIDTSGNEFAAQITLAQVDSTVANMLTTQVVHVKELQPSGTRGGDLFAGVYSTRILNTLENPSGYAWVTLASNQFTLLAGTYDLQAFAPSVTASQNKARLQNITDNTTISLGSAGYANGINAMSGSTVTCTFTIAATKTFEIQHRSAFTETVNGGGEACSFGDDEVYTVVRIEKIFP